MFVAISNLLIVWITFKKAISYEEFQPKSFAWSTFILLKLKFFWMQCVLNLWIWFVREKFTVVIFFWWLKRFPNFLSSHLSKHSTETFKRNQYRMFLIRITTKIKSTKCFFCLFWKLSASWRFKTKLWSAVTDGISQVYQIVVYVTI